MKFKYYDVVQIKSFSFFSGTVCRVVGAKKKLEWRRVIRFQPRRYWYKVEVLKKMPKTLEVQMYTADSFHPMDGGFCAESAIELYEGKTHE